MLTQSKRILPLIMACAVVFGAFVSASAQAVTTTLQLDSTVYGSIANIVGVSGNSAPGFASGSWQAPGTSSKSELYIPASELFSSSITIGDISSLSYWTNKPTTSADPDWTFYIYTQPTGSGDSATWYRSRLNSEPYFTGTPSASDPPNTWHQWSTGGSHPMRFYDANRDGGVYGTYTDPTLADLQAGAITWPSSSTTHNYGSEAVKYFSLQTGSAWASGFTGLVDGLKITRTNGDVGQVNLEVPAPPTFALFAIGLVGLGFTWRRTKGATTRAEAT